MRCPFFCCSGRIVTAIFCNSINIFIFSSMGNWAWLRWNSFFRSKIFAINSLFCLSIEDWSFSIVIPFQFKECIGEVMLFKDGGEDRFAYFRLFHKFYATVAVFRTTGLNHDCH